MIAIVEYNAGNSTSVQFALQRLGVESICTNNTAIIQQAEKVIFPGVGEASSAMQYLQQHGLQSLLPTLTQPVLGICLGMQLLCNYTEENKTNCLGVFPVQAKRFPPTDLVPHMGWNQLYNCKSELFTQLPPKHDVYFLHSYYVPVNEFTIATTQYSTQFSAAMKRNNFYATQFHPEKSGLIGELILTNFLQI